MKLTNIFAQIILTTTAVLMSSCIADMRTALIKDNGIPIDSETKGKSLLATTWDKHGFENLRNHRTYSFQGLDVWKGMMGRMGKPWPEAKSQLQFKYALGTFDSQVHFKDGKRQGVTAGLQSWQYYETEPGSEVKFKPYNPRIGFGLSAYHYFFEMLDRLKRAPIIAYAGERVFNGQPYDLVFATWEKPSPHMQHDQYILYINRNTLMLDYAVYSLRDNYLKIPGYKAFYGSVKFSDYREVNGVLIPHRQTVFLNQPKKKEKKHIHQLLVSNFQFDSFDIKELYPDSTLEKLGDSKN